MEHSVIAEQTGQVIFGTKGVSCLSQFLKIPSHVLLDPLHLLFENCSKALFMKFLDTSMYRCEFYLGRHVTHYENIIDRIFMPHFLQPPKSLSELTYSKARDILIFLFYYRIPTLYV
jgi:hypothetical protein